MVREVVIYIHGVSNGSGSHDREYATLHNGVRAANLNWPAAYLGVEWGWNSVNSAQPSGHELLSTAEEVFGGRALKALDAQWDLTLNPTRLVINQFRPLMMYGFADMFYYVSSDGKNSVRHSVAKQIVSYLKDVLASPAPPPISLTIVGHSAGSVVAFDLAFYLFYKPSSPRAAVTSVQDASAGEHTFIKPEEVPAAEAQHTVTELRKLRDMAQQGHLRIRRLYTIGSPISFLIYRSNSLLKILSDAGRVDPANHGLTQTVTGEPPLEGPRWINIWDKDDPIAWPVEPLMQRAGEVVVDDYVDLSDNPLSAHNEYWASQEVQKRIGKRW